MTKNELKNFLRKKTSYLKKGKKYLSEMFNLSEEDCKLALREIKEEIKEVKEVQIKRLFFDIETTPNVVYTWRAGYNITVSPESIIKERKIISIHWKWQGENKVHNLSWDKNQEDKKMLAKFIEIANQADEIIAHNGDRFDIKWLRTRCIYHRLPMFSNYSTLDTLKKAKRHFNFNSNKLDYIAQFLGVGKKTDHEGYSLWLKVMDGDKEALKKMLIYGDNDVVILEEVYTVMMKYIKSNVHHGVLQGKETTSCPNCTSNDSTKVRLLSSPMGTLQVLMQCNDCESDFKISHSKYLKL